MNKYPPVEYQSYLQLDQLLGAQNLKSTEHGQTAHDEMLFIIVHQAYELWFKQIITEIDSVLEIFVQDKVQEDLMGTVVARLERIIKIQGVLIQQIDIMETMTPLDFLEFRDFLYPASGFQSVQNRLIENKMGLAANKRLRFNQASYEKHLGSEFQKQVLDSEKSENVFSLVERWLERTPFLNVEKFNFWKEYREAVITLFEQDRYYIESMSHLQGAERENSLNEMDQALKTFEALFDEDKYNELRDQGHWRFSYRALHAALFINIYRDQPALQLPFRLLQALQNIDENFTTWRYRHALMAHRMLGKKIGTGGSSGHKYLEQATEKHKVFSDLFNLTTFFIPRSKRPQLPEEILKKLNFSY